LLERPVFEHLEGSYADPEHKNQLSPIMTDLAS
jgi:hypothetical protein